MECARLSRRRRILADKRLQDSSLLIAKPRWNPLAGTIDEYDATPWFLSRCARQHDVWSLPLYELPRDVHALRRFQNGERPSRDSRSHDASPPPDGALPQGRDVQDRTRSITRPR